MAKIIQFQPKTKLPKEVTDFAPNFVGECLRASASPASDQQMLIDGVGKLFELGEEAIRSKNVLMCRILIELGVLENPEE